MSQTPRVVNTQLTQGRLEPRGQGSAVPRAAVQACNYLLFPFLEFACEQGAISAPNW